MSRRLKEKATCVAALYDELGGGFEQGLKLLAERAPHEDVVARWKETLRLYGASSYAGPIKEMLAQLKKQIAEEYDLAEQATPSPERLPVERRIGYLLDRLPEMHRNDANTATGWGDFEMFATHQGRLVSDELAAIGRPALPGLIQHSTIVV